MDLGKRRRRLAAGKLLNEGRPADAAIAQIDETKRITHRRIVAARSEEILAQQESRTAGDRDPGARRGVWLRVGLAVGADNPERLPGGVSS